MGRRSKEHLIDWAPIQREYSLGQASLRQLGVTFDMDPAAIHRKAKKEGWPRDKRAEVKALSEAQLITVGLDPSDTRTSTPTTQDVAAAATVRTTVILAHRRDAGRARALAMTMLEELEAMTKAPLLLKELSDCLAQMAAVNEVEPVLLARADAALGQAMTLGNRAGVLKSLSESLSKVVQIEREAFGLNDPTPPPPGGGDAAAGAFSDFAAFKAKFNAAVAAHQGAPK